MYQNGGYRPETSSLYRLNNRLSWAVTANTLFPPSLALRMTVVQYENKEKNQYHINANAIHTIKDHYVCFDEEVFSRINQRPSKIKDMNPDADFKTIDKSGHTLITD